MIKLPRKWRRNLDANEDGGGSSQPKYDDTSDPMDTQDQEKLIRLYELKQAKQSLLWRKVFAALVLCVVVFLIYSILHQATSPWELRYHAYFEEEMNSWAVIAAESLAVLSCLMAIKGLFHSSKTDKNMMWYSSYIGLLQTVFWMFYMLRLPKFGWDVIWIPLGPLSVAGMCLYVDYLLAESSEEIRKLRGYMYAFKAA